MKESPGLRPLMTSSMSFTSLAPRARRRAASAARISFHDGPVLVKVLGPPCSWTKLEQSPVQDAPPLPPGPAFAQACTPQPPLPLPRQVPDPSAVQ